MVIGAFSFSPVVGYEGAIEIPALARGFSIAEHVMRALAECQWCQPWWTAQAFLCGGVTGINVPRIHLHGNTAEGRHRIYNQEGTMVMTECSKVFQ